MSQVEPEDLQPVLPGCEIRLTGVAAGGVSWKTCRHDQMGPGSEELEPRLIADLHPPACQQCHSTGQICQLTSLREVELRAGRTHLVVKVMENREFLLTDVAMLRLDRLAKAIILCFLLLECSRGKHIRARKYRLPAHGPDPGSFQCLFLAPNFFGLFAPDAGPDQLTS